MALADWRSSPWTHSCCCLESPLWVLVNSLTPSSFLHPHGFSLAAPSSHPRMLSSFILLWPGNSSLYREARPPPFSLWVYTPLPLTCVTTVFTWASTKESSFELPPYFIHSWITTLTMWHLHYPHTMLNYACPQVWSSTDCEFLAVEGYSTICS